MTKQEKLFRAIGYVGDDLIAKADAPVEKRKSNADWVKWAALAACCVLVIGLASRLPLGSMKSAAPAETAAMTAEEPAAAEDVEAAAAAEQKETLEESAVEAAPAEEDPASGESGVVPRGETATNGYVDAALEQELLNTTLGPVKLGMASEDVRSILGAPGEESDEFYVCTDRGDYRYVTWRYNFTNDPNFISDVTLGFADVADGFVLNEITTFGTSDWALPSGVKNGSTVQALLEAYPDAEPGINGYDGEIFAYGVETGHVRLTFLVEKGVITSISLGTYYEAPGYVDETPAEEPAYSFASSDMIVYQKEEDGWLSYHMKGQPAKKLEVILGIEELTPIDKLPQARYYIDFQNGTVVMLGQDRLSGAVYTCGDLEAFRTAMDAGTDPAPYLTLIEQAKFPYGTDAVIQELTVAE